MMNEDAQEPQTDGQEQEPDHESEFGEAGRDVGELVGHGLGTLVEEELGPAPAYELGQGLGDIGEDVGQDLGREADALQRIGEGVWHWVNDPSEGDPNGGSLPPGGAPEHDDGDGG